MFWLQLISSWRLLAFWLCLNIQPWVLVRFLQSKSAITKLMEELSSFNARYEPNQGTIYPFAQQFDQLDLKMVYLSANWSSVWKDMEQNRNKQPCLYSPTIGVYLFAWVIAFDKICNPIHSSILENRVAWSWSVAFFYLFLIASIYGGIGKNMDGSKKALLITEHFNPKYILILI